MSRLDDIRARVEAAKPGKCVAAIAPPNGETKVEYVAESLSGDPESPLWVVVEAGAWDESENPFYDLYAVTGDGPYGEAHAELFANACEDLSYLLNLVKRAVPVVRAAEFSHVDDALTADQWLDDVRVKDS